MLEVAGGILIALVVLFCLPFLLSGRFWVLITSSVLPAIFVVILFAAFGRDILWLIVIGAGIAILGWGLGAIQDRAGGSIVRAIFEGVKMHWPGRPIKGPEDPRHPEHLKWANREGRFSGKDVGRL